VYANGKRWKAEICYGGEKRNLGTFDTKQEAALAYDRTARECGEQKPLNYESIEAGVGAAEEEQAKYTLTHNLFSGPPQPKPRPPSGYYGVYASWKRWKAQITYGGEKRNLGTFDTKQDAALAYDRAARECEEVKPLNYESIKAGEEAAAEAQASHIRARQPPQPKPRPPSGYYGVYANGKRWRAEIAYGGKQHGLGYFDTKQEAALAYDRAARECGEEKPLNFDSIEAGDGAAEEAQAKYTLTQNLFSGPPQPKPRPPSGYYGVYAIRKRWKAEIYYGGEKHYLGTFATKQEAALAYDRAARECGEENPLNYDSIKAAEEAAAEAQAEMFADALVAGSLQPKPRPASGY
jgi:hypothetical protein